MHEETTEIVFASPDFSWTRWTAEDITALKDPVLALLRIDLETITSIPANERNFNNTVRALELAFAEVHELLATLSFVSNTSPDAAIRDTGTVVLDEIEQELIEISYDENLYTAVKEYEARKEPLGTAEAKLLKDMLRDYRRMGFELSREKRDELKQVVKEISEIENAYKKNLNDESDSLIVSEEDVVGIPSNILERFKKVEGGYEITLKYPDYLPFMQNAARSEKRRELAEKYFRRGGEANMEFVRSLMRLKRQRAHLLGYPNHAAYQTETRMAKTAEAAVSFENDLVEKLRPGVLQDIATLRALKKADGHDEELMYYDIAYYINQDQKQRLDIDDEVVRPYFPLQKVIAGMFDIYQTLLGVTFIEDRDVPGLHPDVKTYRIEEEGVPIAYFFMDLHPRDGKYGHAAAFTISNGRELESGKYVMPVSGLVCNFTKPTATAPSLMTHGEVETFFHEFGHIMHETLTRAAYPSQSSVSVAWDFVEAPSQMLENWVWDPAMLAKISGHYQTNEPLPAELLEKLLALKKHFQAYSEGRQVMLGTYDLALNVAESTPDLQELYSRLYKEHFDMTFPQDLFMAANFGHLVGSYSAGYYGYMWSKVYAADMFTRFAEEGLLNPKTGRAYRMWILEKGSSMEEIDLVRGFLGREPNNEAFLKELGIAA